MKSAAFLELSGGIFLLVIAVSTVFCTIFLIQSLSAFRRLLGVAEQFIRNNEEKCGRILENLEDNSSRLRSMIAAVSSAVENAFSFPTMATQIGKEIVARIFGRK